MHFVSGNIATSLLLVGPEGAAIFLIQVLQKRNITVRSWHAVRLAIITAIAATIVSIAIVFVGTTVLHHSGISMAAVRLLGGLICINAGLSMFGIDLLHPFKASAEEEEETEIEVTRVEGPVSFQKSEDVEKSTESSFKVRMRRIPNELAVVFVPLVFPTTVGTAYVTWLLNQMGDKHPAPKMGLILVIVITMFITLLSMFLAILIGSHPRTKRIMNGLAKFGCIVFILFGFDSIGGAIFTYIHTAM